MKITLNKILLSFFVLLFFFLVPSLTMAAPITLFAPWNEGERWIAGSGCYSGGSFYNEGAHVGSDYYAVDFNGVLNSNCQILSDDDGKEIRTTNAGTVSHIEQDPNSSGYGFYVLIDHGNGITSRYAHLKYNPTQNPGIQVNQQVTKGQIIGYNGATGGFYTPHLHFVLYQNGSSVRPDPMDGQSLCDSCEGALILSSNRPNSNPTSPNLSSPSNNSTVGSLGVNFVWYGATDPDGDSPLDYSLVIKDGGGATVLETQWLESTYSYNYTLPSNGNYTWFVKVGDRHGGQNQSATWNLTVSVPSPTVSLSASRTYTQTGRKIMLNWSSTNAASVASSNFGATSVSGTTTAYPTKTTTYTITVNGNPGSNPSTATSNVTIYVSPLGDFNRDGNSDVAGQYNPYGDWWVGTNNNNSAFNGMTKWLASQLANTNINVLHGDYNNDGYLDIAARDISAGNWWIGLNNGNDTYGSMQMVLSNQAAGSDYDVFGGDFNGDGLADFGVKYRPWGRWYIALNQGSLNFNTFQQWLDGNLAGNDSDTFTGDFNKDGYTDIGGRYRPNGDWWIGINSGNSTFNGMTQWLTGQAGGNDWDMIIADYNNDSYTDIGGRYRPNGDWWVGLNNQSSAFNNMTQWLVGQAGGTNWDTFAGDFNKDGLADIGGRYSPYGDWWISLNTGNSDFGNMTKWLAGNAAGSGWNVINKGSE